MRHAVFLLPVLLVAAIMIALVGVAMWAAGCGAACWRAGRSNRVSSADQQG